MLSDNVTLMRMEKRLIKILLPLLLLALVAVYFESGSVKKIDMDSGYSTPMSEPQSMPSSNKNTAKGESRLTVGERYDSLDELVIDQRAAGYLKIGYFGKNWPATVAEIKNDNDRIAFVKRDGTKHNYTGFDGYRMKAVRLNAGERETIVVFRSEKKR